MPVAGEDAIRVAFSFVVPLASQLHVNFSGVAFCEVAIEKLHVKLAECVAISVGELVRAKQPRALVRRDPFAMDVAAGRVF
jgi:hypothetical protein